MKKIIGITLLFSFAFLVSSCSPTINYLGNYYNPTQEVQIFFSPEDIKQEYEVMGVVNNGVGLEYSNSKAVQKAMVKKAKEVGADAILFKYSERVFNPNAPSIDNTSQVYYADFLKYKN